jgi:hypothetical protein
MVFIMIGQDQLRVKGASVIWMPYRYLIDTLQMSYGKGIDKAYIHFFRITLNRYFL